MKHYYNEHDPKVVEWLHNLIKNGVIPKGEIDERSIVDVRATDLTGFVQCHFFAGIGGWAEALRIAGWPEDRPIWTGSCPCQPFSTAGKQLGEADERHLWPVFRELIREYNRISDEPIPEIAGEQVASKAGRVWLSGVRADMEAMGYAFGGADLCSAGVGSPNLRQRLFWLANASRGRLGELRRTLWKTGYPDERLAIGSLANTNGGIAGNGELQSDGEQRFESQDGGVGRVEDANDGRCPARGGRESEASQCESGDGVSQQRSSPCGLANSEHPERRSEQQESGTWSRGAGLGGSSGMGHTVESRLEGHTGDGDDGNQPGRLSQEPGGSTSSPSSVGHFWDRFDLLHCTDGKARRVESRSFPLVTGVQGRVVIRRTVIIGENEVQQEYWYNRATALRGFGNAINPYVGAIFISAYLEI